MDRGTNIASQPEFPQVCPDSPSSDEDRGGRQPSPLSLYLSAIENEFYLDEFALSRHFRDAYRQLGHVLLRPTRFHAYLDASHKVRVLKIALEAVLFLWWPSYYFLSLWHFLRVLTLKLRFLGAYAQPAAKVVLTFSPWSRTVIPLAVGGPQGTVRIGWPWQDPDIPLPRLLRWRDLFRAYKLTVKFPSYLHSVARGRNFDKAFRLQTYDAYYFFATLRFLERLDGMAEWVCFCNTYDRWAVLIAECVRKSRLCLVQHGFLAQDCAPPTKLAKVDLLYVFDERSKDIFLGGIIKNCREVRYVRAKIDLSPLAVGDFERSVLIIAQPIALSMEQGIVRQLASRYPRWLILVKPHPLYSSKAYKSLEVFPNVKIILERDFYPFVDLAITCNSTLGLEYQSAGQRVYFFDGKSLNEIVSDLHATFEPLREAE